MLDVALIRKIWWPVASRCERIWREKKGLTSSAQSWIMSLASMPSIDGVFLPLALEMLTANDATISLMLTVLWLRSEIWDLISAICDLMSSISGFLAATPA